MTKQNKKTMMSPLGDIENLNYTSGMKNETKKNEPQKLEQKLQTRDTRSQEEHQPADYERRGASLDNLTEKQMRHIIEEIQDFFETLTDHYHL